MELNDEKCKRKKIRDGVYTPAMFTQIFAATVLEKMRRVHGMVGRYLTLDLFESNDTDAAMGFYDSCLKGNVNVKYEQEANYANRSESCTTEGKPAGDHSNVEIQGAVQRT